MLEIYFRFSAFSRAIIYASICLSSLLVASSYYRAYRNEKPTWIIQSVILLFASISFTYLFFLLSSLVNLIEGYGLRYKILVSLLPFTDIPMLLSIFNFWNASLNQKTNNRGGNTKKNTRDNRKSRVSKMQKKV